MSGKLNWKYSLKRISVISFHLLGIILTHPGLDSPAAHRPPEPKAPPCQLGPLYVGQFINLDCILQRSPTHCTGHFRGTFMRPQLAVVPTPPLNNRAGRLNIILRVHPHAPRGIDKSDEFSSEDIVIPEPTHLHSL